MQRRRVVLPQPLGPRSTTTSPRMTSTVMPRRTSSAAEALLRVDHLHHRRDAHARRRSEDRHHAGEERLGLVSLARGEEPLEFRLKNAESGDDHEVPEGGDRVELHHLEVAGGLDLGGVQQLDDADRECDRSVLEHRDEFVAGRRDHDAQRLGQDDAPHRLEVGHAQALRSVHLTGLDGANAGADDFRHVGGFVQPERDDGDAEARPVVAEDVLFDELAETEVHQEEL